MELIRARQGRLGLRGLTLSTFCDLVWLEIWDDVSAMADVHTYHRIIGELFLEGKDPYDITYEVTEHDRKGKEIKKTKRLSETPSATTRTQRIASGATVLEQWKKRGAELKAAASVASSPDG